MIIIKEQVRRCDDNGKCREKEDGKSAVFALVAASARHNIYVDINGINRVADSNLIVNRENVADIAAVGFCTV